MKYVIHGIERLVDTTWVYSCMQDYTLQETQERPAYRHTYRFELS